MATVSIWGTTGYAKELTGDAARDVRPRNGSSAIETLCRRIERELGAKVVACRPDGHALNRGQIESDHYQLTIGRWSKRENAYSVLGSCWVAIYR